MLAWKNRSTKAFTLIELLVVIVIIAVLAVIVMPKFANRSTQAKQAAAQGDLKLLRNALQMCQTDTGLYPASLNDLTSSSAPGTSGYNSSGTATAFSSSSWNGPYLQGNIPQDPTASSASGNNANWTYTNTTGTVASTTNSAW